ncbi:hypothetical protein ACHAWX_001753 [Stephanocyclus meneghinianus]
MSLPSLSTIPENCSHDTTVRTTALIPTFFEKPLNTIDLNDLNSSSKLDALKTRDPFMYFSIPALRVAALHNNEVDESMLRSDTSNRECERKVTRKTRLSMECHADLLLEQLLDEYNSVDLPSESTVPENCSPVSTIRSTTLIPTFFEEKTLKTMDLNEIDSSSKLADLKTRDPFMYYSIPALRCAALHNKEVDMSMLRRDTSNRQIERKVTRKTRVSMECHAELILEQLSVEYESVHRPNETKDNHDLYENLFSF